MGRQPKLRDRVRVSFEATVSQVGPNGYLTLSRLSGTELSMTRVPTEFVEVIDDPSKDPVGTVRKRESGTLYIRREVGRGWHPWTPFTGCVLLNLRDSDMAGRSEIIGAVPGTPAAEQEAA